MYQHLLEYYKRNKKPATMTNIEEIEKSVVGTIRGRSMRLTIDGNIQIWFQSPFEKGDSSVERLIANTFEAYGFKLERIRRSVA